MSKNWLKYFLNPMRIGPLERADTEGTAGGGCGDLVRIQLRINEGVISDCAFLASGCPAAIAGAAACCELIYGKSLLDAAKVSTNTIAARLIDLPAERRQCLKLSIDAFSAAIETFLKRAPGFQMTAGDPVAVGMSGGVDSSTAALLLLESGYDLFGLTMRLHDRGKLGAGSCCTPADIDDARAVAAHLGFAHVVIDMTAEFAADVIDKFCRSYIEGKTPNPCVECNRKIRFAYLRELLRAWGVQKMATGHYARIAAAPNGGFELRRAVDLGKDQSYMFWAADQSTLAGLLAPLGDLTKDEVRELAAAAHLTTAQKSESQDVCFIPDGDYATFVADYLKFTPHPGEIVGTDGSVLGPHDGLINYTVGQRRGLKISAAAPLYVTRLDMINNQLVVGSASDLLQKEFFIDEVNYLAGERVVSGFQAEVMTRYNGPTYRAFIEPVAENRAVVRLSRPAGPIAPGQSAVFYDGELLLGGGIISR